MSNIIFIMDSTATTVSIEVLTFGFFCWIGRKLSSIRSLATIASLASIRSLVSIRRLGNFGSIGSSLNRIRSVLGSIRSRLRSVCIGLSCFHGQKFLSIGTASLFQNSPDDRRALFFFFNGGKRRIQKALGCSSQ